MAVSSENQSERITNGRDTPLLNFSAALRDNSEAQG
jgi:hypothetical protein